MKKMASNSMVPAKPKGGKAPSVTETAQQKVGVPPPGEAGKGGRAGALPTKPQKPKV